MSERPLVVGAVAYDPKVVTIWELMRDYFREAGVPTDYVLFSNYEAQVDALFEKAIDIAWNTNVAYVRSEKRAGGACRVLAMRDTDLDFTSRMIVRADAGIAGLQDLKGRRLAVGSADSAQAALVPLAAVRDAGLDPDRDLELIRFDIDVGKHGDTGASELEVLRALRNGDADAGMIGYVTWIREQEQGRVDGALRSVWTSEPYCHCNFTALPGLDDEVAGKWTEALLAMSGSDPRWRRLMELEGLTAWIPGRKEGYEPVTRAVA
ncbi:MAG: phosphate/phosphite/phosphonate ABC transporter substrate-binding protein [Actinomycetota bacterium]